MLKLTNEMMICIYKDSEHHALLYRFHCSGGFDG